MFIRPEPLGSFSCHCVIDHFNIFYLLVNVVAEWQWCLKLFDCGDKKIVSIADTKKASSLVFLALLNVES